MQRESFLAHLEDDGQLLRRGFRVSNTHQPDLERRQLLGEELRGLVVLLPGVDIWELGEDVIQGQIPGLPERVLVGGRGGGGGGGGRGCDSGVHLYDLITLSARRKFRNRLATRRS